MLLAQHLSFSKTLNPPFFLPPTTPPPNKPISPSFFRHNSLQIRALAGRSKKQSPEGGGGGGRIEGLAELHQRLKRNVRQKSKKLAESFFYRLKNPNKNYADNLTEDELNMIGLGYDRMVRFMDKDDPNLKHPYDWYKYGEFGPYSWRGVVLGDPIVGRFTDERVTMYSEVKDQEEWEKIEQFEMEVDFGERLKKLDKIVGFKHYWVFVRHPKWRLSEQPWEQWTLVSEVVVQAGQERIDKWNLMGRLGNTTRKLITQCAAWFRPDIIYVKRPVYQCRFEPQMDFFRGLTPLLDPETERDFMCELRNEDDGSVETCTYYEGLCKIVKVSKKAFVDDVVNAYEKLSDEKKSKCLEFLFNNHPVLLLHPYTKEWKAKLEEAELGCDAPDDDDECKKNEEEFEEWIEEDSQGGDDDDVVADMEEGGEEDEMESEEEEEEDEKFWDEKLKKEMSSAEKMENLARWSVERTTELYKRQLSRAEAEEKGKVEGDGDESALRGVRAKVDPEEWKIAGIGKWRKRVKKSRIPPELFLRAAVKPFTYRNLVKEIVLTRHAILDGEIGTKN
ncbi:uncharacterized protein LOC126667580 [Mercurialis annua]|uniref:uncharacterized protein LOC126667580 n=1 Tax=Mercurialis annua TaxID=3986 RepID=UPI00215E4DC5|nr:uncharacterized protein LOC126667580 [Mercurialis annua]